MITYFWFRTSTVVNRFRDDHPIPSLIIPPHPLRLSWRLACSSISPPGQGQAGETAARPSAVTGVNVPETVWPTDQPRRLCRKWSRSRAWGRRPDRTTWPGRLCLPVSHGPGSRREAPTHAGLQGNDPAGTAACCFPSRCPILLYSFSFAHFSLLSRVVCRLRRFIVRGRTAVHERCGYQNMIPNVYRKYICFSLRVMGALFFFGEPPYPGEYIFLHTYTQEPFFVLLWWGPDCVLIKCLPSLCPAFSSRFLRPFPPTCRILVAYPSPRSPRGYSLRDTTLTPPSRKNNGVSVPNAARGWRSSPLSYHSSSGTPRGRTPRETRSRWSPKPPPALWWPPAAPSFAVSTSTRTQTRWVSSLAFSLPSPGLCAGRKISFGTLHSIEAPCTAAVPLAMVACGYTEPITQGSFFSPRRPRGPLDSLATWS